MKTAIRITQVFVALLFIISGLVKANDPLGLSYKMQEFFELWNAELTLGSFFAKNLLIRFFEFSHQHALLFSVIMITLEVASGIALLIGWKKKFILWLLLLLIVFFTFLTGYAYGSGKFTNCGCFGDCLPITPLTSFIKDLVLLVLIMFLLMGQRYIQPVFGSRMRNALLAGSLLFTVLIQWYVLNYLPFADCLPFKKGNNIAEQMKPPPGSVPDSIATRFIYEKGGKQYEFAPENLPADFDTYTFKDRVDKLIRKGNAEPPIKGFSLTNESGEDATQSILGQPKAVLVFALDAAHAAGWMDAFRALVATAQQKKIPVYLATANREEFIRLFARHKLEVPVYACDFTVIRTAARTSPAIYILERGTIKQKYAWRKTEQVTAALRKG